MTIHIETLEFETIIGLLEFERFTPQRVIVDLEAEYSYKSGEFLNYADLSALIQETIHHNSFELLEDALLTLQKNISENYPQIEFLKLKITKPDILNNCSVALSDSWRYQLS